MRSKISTLLLLCLLPTLLLAQDRIPYQSWYNIQNDFSEQVCPYDSSEMVVLPTQWAVYQTLDGRWDGTVDSSQCLTFFQMDNDWLIDLETLNPDLPLFFRYKMEGQEVELPSNGLYRGIGSYWTDAQVVLADSCANEMCSGMLAIYNVPYSADSTVQRVVRELVGQYKEANGCWTTENLDSIYLEEYIMKFTFDEENLSGLTFKPQNFYSEELDPSWEYGPAYAFVFYEYMAISETTYRGYLSDAAFSDDWYLFYYIQQNTTGFPSFNNYTYVEAFPDLPADTVLDLILYFESEDELNFQPFTGIRGALVEGSDSLRHNLTLDFAMPNLCQAFIVDVIVPDNTTYLMGDGSFEFGNSRSCFMFQTGGTLAIKEEASFEYGREAIGVLGLAGGGHLDLKTNSTLTVDNRMQLVAMTGSEREQAYAHLAPGSTLRFGPNSSLKRSQGKNMYLNVYMNGGTLDDSELSAEERQLIRRIYPETPLPTAGRALVSPNPSSGEVMLVLDGESTTNWPYQVIDNLGREVANGKLEALAQGRYRLQPSTSMSNGLYRVLIQTDNGLVIANWVYE